MNHYRILSTLGLIALLSGCLDTQNNPKQSIGTLLGAGAGALLGSQFGDGKGRLVAVAIGTLGGAYLGGEVGKTMDQVDRMKASAAENEALEFYKDGSTRKLNNPNTGNSGSVTPKRTFQTASGENCREYEHTIMIDGKSEIAKGTACRKLDGTWHVIN